MKAVIAYWSKTGNTRKTAEAIKQGLEETGVQVTILEQHEAEGVDFFDYDVVCVGAPAYSWHPPEPMDQFLKAKFAKYRVEGRIKPSAPKIHGKYALIFVTYSGPHTGIDEATPAGKYMAQFFDHLGFTLLAEWYVLSEFHGSAENCMFGRMGDIRGKPTSEELQKIREDTAALARKLANA